MTEILYYLVGIFSFELVRCLCLALECNSVSTFFFNLKNYYTCILSSCTKGVKEVAHSVDNFSARNFAGSFEIF